MASFTNLLICFLVLIATAKAANCPAKWFDCGNGKCISMMWHCDGEDDCGNQMDEVDCSDSRAKISASCPSAHFHCNTSDLCLPDKWRCDGHNDCPDGGDEKNCVVSDCLGFKCKNHECIPNQWHCDDIEDCKDGSDELDCSSNHTHHTCTHHNGLFECSSGECIPRLKVCNGHKDCSHGDDEGAHCLATDSCGHHNCSQGCFVTPKGEQCFCKDGYQLGGDNSSCHDIDECTIAGFCSHSCFNTIGAFSCTCQEGYNLVGNRSCVANAPEPLLLFSDQQRIRAYYLRSGRYLPVHDAIGHVLGLDMYGFDQTVYWADQGMMHSGIYSCKLDGTNLKAVVSSGLKDPEDVAVDWVGRNIYITDAKMDKLVVCKLDGSICTTLFSGIHMPRAIAVDPATGYMFWTEWGRNPGIYMSGMDGSDQIAIARTDLHWPNGLTYDPTTSRVYWADAQLNRIEYFDVHTRQRSILLEDTVFSPFSMTVFEDNLYWSDWITGSLDVCNKFTGRNQTMILRENQKQMMGVHVYHPVQHQHVDNPCWSNECSHLCLLGPRKTFKCACPGHMILGKDGRTCDSNATEFLLVGVQKSLKKIYPESIGQDVVFDMMVPHHMAVGDYTYDNVNGVIYMFDGNKYAIIAVNATSGASRILYSTHLDSVQGLTFDDCTGNLYWLDGNHGLLEVGSISKNARATLIKDMERPVDLALHPDMKYLYIANLGSEPYIMRADMDGQNQVKLLATHIGLPVSLHLDEHSNILYWADAKLGTIEQMQLSEASILNTRRMIVRDKIHHVMSIAVHDDTLYWTDMDSGYLYHAPLNDKHERASLVPLPGSHNSSSVKKIKLVHKHEHVNHQGCEHNGGCSDICVLSAQGASCICSDGRRHPAGETKTCVDEKTSCKSEDDWICADKTSCILGLWRCDGNKDCDDHSDEDGCESECPVDHFKCDNGKCIIGFWQCDQVDDCGDNSDEHNCTKADCVEGLFSCGQGQCVPYAWRCDNKNDCANKEDEMHCDAKVCANDKTQLQCENGQCVPMQWVCDGEDDCTDGTDEKDCHLKNCKDTEFRCRNAICVDKELLCDRTADCSDGSDEEHCEYTAAECHADQFTCQSDGRCVYPNDVCDGFRDCEKGEDELNCSNHHVCSEHESYCDTGANLTCIPHLWLCDGENDCGDWSDEQRPQCKVRGDALPTTTGRPCKDSSFPCESGDCIPYELVCNKKQDCLDGSDEGSHCQRACSHENGACAQLCRPTPTTASCACHDGYALNTTNMKDCYDVDECEEGGICSHFCNNTKGSYKCRCAHGYQLASDNRRCKPSPDLSYQAAFVLYQLPDKIRSIGLLNNEQHVIVTIHTDDMKGMDYDFETATVFWIESTRGAIMAHNMAAVQTGHSKPANRLVKDGLVRPAHLSWDWLARNLYFFSESYIMVVNENGTKFAPKFLPIGVAYIHSLLVIPEEGLLFFSVWSDSTSASGLIERANMDGTGRRRIISNDNRIRQPMSLTADLVLKRLYWTDTTLDQVGMCDYNGRNRKILLAYSLANPIGMGMFEDYLYIANYGTDVMTKVSKFDGQARVIFHRGDVKSDTIKVVHKVLQFDGINYCKNMSCSNLCVLKPNGSACSCDPGFSLYESGQCAVDRDSAVDTYPHNKKDFELLCASDLCANGGTCYVDDKKPTCTCIPGFFGRTCQEVMISQFQHEEANVVAWVFGAIAIGVLLVLLALMIINYQRYDFSEVRRIGSKMYRKPVDQLKKVIPGRFSNPIFSRKDESLITDAEDQYQDSDEQGNDSDSYQSNVKFDNVITGLTTSASGSPLLFRCDTDASFTTKGVDCDDYEDTGLDYGDDTTGLTTNKKKERVKFFL